MGGGEEIYFSKQSTAMANVIVMQIEKICRISENSLK
jgi:hypothetical protein